MTCEGIMPHKATTVRIFLCWLRRGKVLAVQRSGTAWKWRRWPFWAPPSLVKRTVSVDVKQHWTERELLNVLVFVFALDKGGGSGDGFISMRKKLSCPWVGGQTLTPKNWLFTCPTGFKESRDARPSWTYALCAADKPCFNERTCCAL